MFVIQILKQFLEIERDHISFIQSLYIRLSSEDVSMHKEAIDLIKQQQQVSLLASLSIVCVNS